MHKEACIVAVGNWGGKCLLKNRDRNYTPELRIIHELRNGVEVLYVQDETTEWAEGLNEYGIGIVNSALMVGRDEAEKKLVKIKGKKSKDGGRILKALESKTVKAALNSAKSYKGGIKGHTMVSDEKTTYIVEATSKHDVEVTEADNTISVRTNHGNIYEDAGYTEGEDYISSQYRKNTAEKALKKVKKVEDVALAIYGERSKDRTTGRNMVRDTDKMVTSSQLVLDLKNLTAHLYLIPGKVNYKGYDNKLPKGRKPTLSVKIYLYTELDKKGAFEVTEIKPGKKVTASLVDKLAEDYVERYYTPRNTSTKDNAEPPITLPEVGDTLPSVKKLMGRKGG